MSGSTEADMEEIGRAVVRDVFINRLRDAGLRRPRGMTEATHVKVMDRLAEWLSYMHRDNLATLAESVLLAATQPGSGAGLWPPEVLIRQWAQALQAKPFSQHPIIASWLRSREGPVAVAGGYLVELLRWLRRFKRQMTGAELDDIKRKAVEMQHTLARVRERIDKGVPWPDDHAILGGWMEDYRVALQYVDEGTDRRTSQALGADVADRGPSRDGVAA